MNVCLALFLSEYFPRTIYVCRTVLIYSTSETIVHRNLEQIQWSPNGLLMVFWFTEEGRNPFLLEIEISVTSPPSPSLLADLHIYWDSYDLPHYK